MQFLPGAVGRVDETVQLQPHQEDQATDVTDQSANDAPDGTDGFLGNQIGHETHGSPWPEDVIFRPPALEKTGLQSQDHRGAEDRQAKAQTGPAEVPGRHQHARHPQPDQTDRNEKSRRPNQKNRVSRKNSPKRTNGIHHRVIGHALAGDAVVRRHIIRSVGVEGKEEQSSEGDQHQGADIGKRVAHQRKRFILAATWTAYGHIKGQ